MSSMAADLALTRADLDAMPPDGRRHELLDGAILVTPSPGLAHQLALMALLEALRRTLPDGLVLLAGPFDVVLAEHTVVVPDILVAARGQFTERDLPGPPLLIVEIRSPSTEVIDRTTKRDLYERAGVAHYWLVDPDAPRITLLELVGGRYTEVARIDRPGPVAVADPYPLTLDVGTLRG